MLGNSPIKITVYGSHAEVRAPKSNYDSDRHVDGLLAPIHR